MNRGFRNGSLNGNNTPIRGRVARLFVARSLRPPDTASVRVDRPRNRLVAQVPETFSAPLRIYAAPSPGVLRLQFARLSSRYRQCPDPLECRPFADQHVAMSG